MKYYKSRYIYRNYMATTGYYVNTETFFQYSNIALPKGISKTLQISYKSQSTSSSYYQTGTGFQYSSGSSSYIQCISLLES